MTIANSAQPNWEDVNLGDTFFYPLRRDLKFVYILLRKKIKESF